MGKLIVIEGLDGCGKSTQVALVPEKLKNLGFNSKMVSFPNYDDPSSTLVKMYLNGDFGQKADDVNAFAASLFYAVDRYASYKRHWGEFYSQGGVVVSGRYVESNAYHQASKLPREEWDEYFNWLYETEYNKMGIPKPDLVIFLDMPLEVSQKLLSVRYNGDQDKKDIHEKDTEYMEKCREAAVYAAKLLGWKIINCADGFEPRTVEDINSEIVNSIIKAIE